MRAAVYVRITSDDEGDRAGVGRQRDDCAVECERRGWEPVVFEDNDISASTRSKKARPGYRAMLAAVKAGEVGAIVAYDGYRLHRRPAELEEFITLIEAAQIPVVQVRGGTFNFSDADDRFKARVIGSAAALEAEKTGERVARQKLEGSRAGRPNMGGLRPWGFAEDRVTLDPVEAAEVRDAAQNLLAGESLVSLSRRLGRQPASIRNALVSPRMVGARSYHGQVICEGAWEAVLDPDTWEAVRAVLTARKRGSSEPGGVRARKYLLTGFARCGRCGAKAHGIPNRGRRGYQCQMACTRRSADHVDAMVTEWVLERAVLRVAPPGVDPQLTAAVHGYEARLNEAQEMWSEGDLTKQAYLGLKSTLEAKLVVAQRQLAEATGNAWGPWLEAQSAEERGEQYVENLLWWNTHPDLRERRLLIERYVDRVILHPTRLGRGFRPEDVEIVPLEAA